MWKVSVPARMQARFVPCHNCEKSPTFKHNFALAVKTDCHLALRRAREAQRIADVCARIRAVRRRQLRARRRGQQPPEERGARQAAQQLQHGVQVREPCSRVGVRRGLAARRTAAAAAERKFPSGTVVGLTRKGRQNIGDHRYQSL